MPPRRTLPAETTSFVGREADLLRLTQAFAGGARLVTVTGPPGIGKSRLGMRLAARCLAAGTLRDGVIACEVVDAATVDDLCAALQRALDVPVGREPRGRDVVAELGLRLGDALVLLDNAEQLAGVGPESIGRWLAIAPRVRFLVTSRERLRLAGEVVHELGPLSLPEEGEGVERSEAVRLFVERARAVRPRFAVTPDNAAALAEIVAQLDGIPLAIELGANRMGVLSPSGLLERMPRRFDVLAADIRNPAARQRTLREAIDASFALLSEAEQAALEQVSVLPGGFGVEAAEAIVDLGGVAGAPPLLDVVQSLVDKSLLFTRSATAFPDEVRFGLYASIREHAAERLEASGRATATLRRRAAHFLAMAAGAGGEIEAAQRAALETQNLLAVHRWLVAKSAEEPAAAAGALRIALALERPLVRWGPIASLRAMLDDALLVAGEEVPAALRIRALIARGEACRWMGKAAESLADHEAALALAERSGDALSRAIAAASAGMALREMGRLPEALRWLDRSLPDLRAGGARRVEVRARMALELIYTVMGRGTEARAESEAVLDLARGDGDAELLVMARVSAARLAIAEGRLDEAEADIEEARAEATVASSPYAEALAMNALSLLRQDQGRLAEARSSAETCIAFGRKLESERMEGFSLAQLGTILAESGDLAGARSALERATELLREIGDERAEALYTAALAAVCGLLGHGAEGSRRMRALEGSLREVGDPMLLAAIDVYRAVLDREGAEGAISATRELAARSPHVRTALRILRRAIGEKGSEAIGEAKRPGAIVLSFDGRRCSLPDGREVSFRRGRALRLLLLRLFEERLGAPGQALSRAALFASGWPGERASEEALDNRVYVSISRLRKLGLGGLLLSRDDGFLLDPAVPASRGD